MKWFTGSIAEAIQKSKREKRVFIVYVTGQDEQSKKMDETLETQEVTNLCDKEDCVSLKLKANGEECGFFSQIYPVVTVPSVYFIGVNGSPIEVTAGYVEPPAFCQVIKSVLKNHQAQVGSAPSPKPSPSVASGSGDPGTKTEAAATPSAPLDDRVEIAKQKMEEIRAEKQRKQEEKDKQEEMERRKLGQDMAKLKQFQEEQKRKELQDQLAKERIEKIKERERIKRELEKDRAERAAKYRKEKEVQEKQKEEAKQAKEMAQNQMNSEAEAKKREQARLQIRLPDGSSVSNVFPSSEPFQTVYNFVSERVGSSVQLSTTFPKRTFTEDDMKKSLLSLELAPSAVLIAVPGRKMALSNNPNGGGGLLSLLLSPFIAIWNFLYMLIFGSATSPPPQNRRENTQTESQAAESSPSGRGARPKTAYQRRPLRSDGNITRMTDVRDDDDENATWNGNSTQQM